MNFTKLYYAVGISSVKVLSDHSNIITTEIHFEVANKFLGIRIKYNIL